MGKGIGGGMRRGLLLMGGILCSLPAVLLLVFGQSLKQPQTVITEVRPGPFALPCPVEGTSLIAEQIDVYDGHYMEDGLDRQVSGVASMLLRNAGDAAIIWAEVILQGQEGDLLFQISHVPAGGVVFVLEKNAKPWVEDTYYACRGQAVLSGESGFDREGLEIVPLDIGTLQVKNLTDKPMEKIRIYYKTYAEEPGIYIGGITYYLDISALQTGEVCLLEPDHYAEGYTRIVWISCASEDW